MQPANGYKRDPDNQGYALSSGFHLYSRHSNAPLPMYIWEGGNWWNVKRNYLAASAFSAGLSSALSLIPAVSAVQRTMRTFLVCGSCFVLSSLGF